jgi:hypothetical protein
VRFGNSVGAVVQVLMRSDFPAAEAFFRDHLRVSPTGQFETFPVAPHSITSSSRPSSVSGIVRPSAFAVLRLMISSTFVVC